MTFHARRVTAAQPPVLDQSTVVESKDLWPGRNVLYRHMLVKVVAVHMATTPSGTDVHLAVVRYPGGKEHTVFAGQLTDTHGRAPERG